MHIQRASFRVLAASFALAVFTGCGAGEDSAEEGTEETPSNTGDELGTNDSFDPTGSKFHALRTSFETAVFQVTSLVQVSARSGRNESGGVGYAGRTPNVYCLMERQKRGDLISIQRGRRFVGRLMHRGRGSSDSAATNELDLQGFRLYLDEIGNDGRREDSTLALLCLGTQPYQLPTVEEINEVFAPGRTPMALVRSQTSGTRGGDAGAGDAGD